MQMPTRPKGSRFDFSDQGIFYSALDSQVGCKTTNTGAQNRTALITAFTTIAAAGGGVIVLPHGVASTFVAADFPASANALCLLTIKGQSFEVLCNLAHTTILGTAVKIAGQLFGVGCHQIEVPVNAGTTNIANTTRAVVLNHSGTIAAHTINLPGEPQDGNIVEFYSRSQITALTLAAGAGESIATGHTTTATTAGQSFSYIYDADTTSWYRLK